jgi:dTDP-4-amino-4,6-dideoxygalactose transaminase
MNNNVFKTTHLAPIPFNVPAIVSKEEQYIIEAIRNRRVAGDGPFTKKCHAWLEEYCGCKKALLTTSCTHALEMAAILADIKIGDEVIMSSYTFVSTANAFVLRGAKIIFVDIRPDTMNMDEGLIEPAITDKTRAIIPVHYAGVACDMDRIMDIAARYNLLVIEDAAQGVMSKYKSKFLGTIGHLGCYSFHETKNYSCGEGGALIINDDRFMERAEIIREKGTDRSKYLRGQVDKYTWVDIGSSYLPSELNAAMLLAQLECAREITNDRLGSWNLYYKLLEPLARQFIIEIPRIAELCNHNGHIFYIKTKYLLERVRLIEFLKQHYISAVFHYVPLHSSPAGTQYGIFEGTDCFTTSESERILRLPLWFGMKKEQIYRVVDTIKDFYNGKVG